MYNYSSCVDSPAEIQVRRNARPQNGHLNDAEIDPFSTLIENKINLFQYFFLFGYQ